MLDSDRDIDNLTGIVGSLLLAGAEQDSKRFAEVALDLSEHAQPPKFGPPRLGALGSVVPKDDDQLLNRALSRFSEVVEAEHSDQDIAIAVEAALQPASPNKWQYRRYGAVASRKSKRGSVASTSTCPRPQSSELSRHI